MTANATADLAAWIGRTETVDDIVTATPYAALSATLDRDPERPPVGPALPPLWHWLYFLPLYRQSDVGPDGPGPGPFCRFRRPLPGPLSCGCRAVPGTGQGALCTGRGAGARAPAGTCRHHTQASVLGRGGVVADRVVPVQGGIPPCGAP